MAYRRFADVIQDCEAYRLRGNEQGWQITGSMESKGRPGLGEMREESALNMFKQMDLKGKSQNDTQLKTVHQNTIATIRTYDESRESISKFSCKLHSVIKKRRMAEQITASGVDGRVVIWSV